MAGVSQRTWSSYENGQTTPNMGALLALAANGYPIKGVTSSLMENWSEEQKKEYQRRTEILKTGAFPPEMSVDDFTRIVKAVDDNPPHQGENSGLLSELEKAIHKAIENSKVILSHEARISALEKRLETTPDPEAEYPIETEDGASYTQDPEPEYGRVTYCDDVAAGPPIWQVEDTSRVVDVPRRLIKNKESDYYALRVRGNSMIDALIPDGSMALIRKSDVPGHGKIQVVWIDDRVTLKRMREEKDHRWTLCYEDGTGRTIPLGDKNLIQGDFVAVLPPLSRPYMRGE